MFKKTLFKAPIIKAISALTLVSLILVSCQQTAKKDPPNPEEDTSTVQSQSDTPKVKSYEDDVYGTNYKLPEDDFYIKKTIYSSWLNVWHGSTESWFMNYSMSNYGTRIKIGDEWVVPDSNKKSHRELIFNQAKDAGINVLVMDLTNGHSGWSTISKEYQKMCYNNNMKFAAATHPKGASDVEAVCKYIWETYAQPGKAVFSSSYYYKNSKPLMVLYCTKGEYESAFNSTGEYRSKFEFTWASGEDSETNKWGWQLEAQDGPMPSKDTMYITPAISWNSPASSVDAWRTSLAFLDFGFLAAKESQPQNLVIGSLDDTSEHNGWMISDTSKKTYDMPVVSSKDLEIGLSYHMRDIYGKISTDAYYNRVKQWTSGNVTFYHDGGLLSDGAYKIFNASSKKQFGVDRPKARTKPATDIGAPFKRDYNLSTDMEQYYWFYHLGNNEYKIIKLTSGLSLQPDKNGNLTQQWNDDIPEQRWILTKQSNGNYNLVNKATSTAIYDPSSGDDIIKVIEHSESDTKQQWSIKPVEGRTIS